MNSTEQIDQYINGLTDWRGNMLNRLRKLVHEVCPEIVEEWKWSSPVWSQNGAVCSASAFKAHVGLNFFQGAFLEDPHGLFNGGFDSKKSRTVKFLEGDQINERALKELVRTAVDHNITR
jgi:hypothetical protein